MFNLNDRTRSNVGIYPDPPAWIDLTDSTIENTWVDHQNTVHQNINWGADKPNGGTTQNCAYQMLENGDVVVDDAPCGVAADGWCAMCQNDPCGPGWTYHENHCFKPICPAGGLTYAEAEALCEEEDAHLALPTNDQMHDWIYRFHWNSKTSFGQFPGNSPCWLDLTDIANEGDWVDHNGDRPRYLNWLLNSPDGGTAENCAYQWKDAISSSYVFQDAACSTKIDGWCAVCQKRRCKTMHSKGNCCDGVPFWNTNPFWSFYDDKCYYPHCPSGGIDYFDSQETCHSANRDSKLVDNPGFSTATHNWIYNLHKNSKTTPGNYPGNSPSWIDLQDFGNEGDWVSHGGVAMNGNIQWQATKPDGGTTQNCGYHSLVTQSTQIDAVKVDDAYCDWESDGWCATCQHGNHNNLCARN